MSQDLNQEIKLRQYLLGELSLEEQVLIEQRLFLESAYADLAQAVEDDLVDDYLHNDLNPNEREKFESYFLNNPDHRGDVRIAQALKQYLTSEVLVHPVTGQVMAGETPARFPERYASAGQPRSSSGRRPTIWLALAAAILIIISIIAWIAIRSTQRPDNRSLEAEVPRTSPTELPSQQPGPSPINRNINERNEVVEQKNRTGGSKEKLPKEQPEPTAIVTATILPNLTGRGEGGTNEVAISRQTKSVLLNIPVITITNYDRYHFELLGAGRPIDVRNLTVSVDERLGRIVSVLFPAKRLTQQRYEIRLRGLTAGGVPSESTTYFFTVKKQE